MANLRRINQEDLRNHNLSVTLDTLLRAQKPMSRADLAKETGLTKATLSLLASMLIESGVVQEGEPVVHHIWAAQHAAGDSRRIHRRHRPADQHRWLRLPGTRSERRHSRPGVGE